MAFALGTAYHGNLLHAPNAETASPFLCDSCVTRYAGPDVTIQEICLYDTDRTACDDCFEPVVRLLVADGDEPVSLGESVTCDTTGTWVVLWASNDHDDTDDGWVWLTKPDDDGESIMWCRVPWTAVEEMVLMGGPGSMCMTAGWRLGRLHDIQATCFAGNRVAWIDAAIVAVTGVTK